MCKYFVFIFILLIKFSSINSNNIIAIYDSTLILEIYYYYRGSLHVINFWFVWSSFCSIHYNRGFGKAFSRLLLQHASSSLGIHFTEFIPHNQRLFYKTSLFNCYLPKTFFIFQIDGLIKRHELHQYLRGGHKNCWVFTIFHDHL